MNILRSKPFPIRGVRLLIGPIIFILCIIGFFLAYNSFLVDRSIESLKVSLHGVNVAKTASSALYVAPLIEVQLVDELSSFAPSSEDLISLSYSSDILESSDPERNINDASAIMEDVVRRRESERSPVLQFFDKVNDALKKLVRKIPFSQREKIFSAPSIDPHILKKINEHEKRGEFDEAINLYRDTIRKFLNYQQTPGLILRFGYLLHKLGRFKEAEELYREVNKRFPNTPESRVSNELLGILKKRSLVEKEAEEIKSIIAQTDDKRTLQRLFYKQGLRELSALNLESAKENFNKAISLLPDTNIADMARLRLGVCERLLGQMDKSLESFKSVADMAKDSQLKAWSKHQLSQLFHQKGEYENAIAYLEDMLKDYDDKDIVPLLLFQLGSTYLYDSGDVGGAQKAFEKLRTNFPGEKLVYPGTSFVDKDIQMEVLPEVPDDVRSLTDKTWFEKVLPKEILKRIEARAMNITNGITAMAQEVISEVAARDQDRRKGKYKQGDEIKLEISQSTANQLIKNIEVEMALSNTSVEYSGPQRLKAYGDIRILGNKTLRAYLEGSFKMVDMISQPYWAEEKDKSINYVIYSVDECKVGRISIPPDMINAALRSALEDFNKNFPLDIREFNITGSNLVIIGTVKEDKLRNATGGTKYKSGVKDIILKELNKKGVLESNEDADYFLTDGTGRGLDAGSYTPRSTRYDRQRSGLNY